MLQFPDLEAYLSIWTAGSGPVCRRTGFGRKSGTGRTGSSGDRQGEVVEQPAASVAASAPRQQTFADLSKWANERCGPEWIAQDRSLQVGLGGWRPNWIAAKRCSEPNPAEAAGLKSAQCRFESDWGHGKRPGRGDFGANGSARGPARPGVTPAPGGIAAARRAR